tara:strand:- start:2258 stop:2737 length:480 start_codon:yes stop_codon:yes gene_type:complete
MIVTIVERERFRLQECEVSKKTNVNRTFAHLLRCNSVKELGRWQEESDDQEINRYILCFINSNPNEIRSNYNENVLPPPLDEKVVFGDILFVRKKEDKYDSFTAKDFETFMGWMESELVRSEDESSYEDMSQSSCESSRYSGKTDSNKSNSNKSIKEKD